MAEYIDRAVCLSILRAKANMAVLMDASPYFEKAAQMLEKLPAADVAPVVYGRWEEADWIELEGGGNELVRTPNAALRCSNCRNCFKKELLWKDAFCPNCGAVMDGGNS